MNSLKIKISKINSLVTLNSESILPNQNQNAIEIIEQQKKNDKIIELNTKLSNTIYSSVELMTNMVCVDWERVKRYAEDETKYLEETTNKLNEIGKNYYSLISNFDELKTLGTLLPKINSNYCNQFLKEINKSKISKNILIEKNIFMHSSYTNYQISKVFNDQKFFFFPFEIFLYYVSAFVKFKFISLLKISSKKQL
ncbi:hypothetical protein BpHYR1_012874 [Brachionus plicatilis]|uniref:Uncharacterized protein n=1 Tax=Brachionus plicatilis TaxID=10195 RepID=A0A3M7QFI5_BRAPC|nr:hypothetical protein BpHYR1_012874 [Brachionus plicatilis]